VALSAEEVGRNVANVRDRIARAGRDWREITLVAVTKGLPDEVIGLACGAGLVDLGENRPEAIVDRHRTCNLATEAVRWHCLGTIQRRKVRKVAGLVHLWHALDRTAAGEELAQVAPGAAVLVQVNTTGEARKSGCTPGDAADFVTRLVDLGLDVRGLMTIGPLDDLSGARRSFRLLADLARELHLSELSMGMSDDLEVAIEEGATIVRVGRALFGPRPAGSAR
jgi:pyridoxal phosphate enzyme (YggS family)